MEEKSIDYSKKMTKEYPCFEFWFTVDCGCITAFNEGNSGIGYIYGLPMNVVEDIIEGIKDEIEGNYHDKLPEKDEHIITVGISEISYFGGQWSEDACAYEVHPGYWYSTEFKRQD